MNTRSNGVSRHRGKWREEDGATRATERGTTQTKGAGPTGIAKMATGRTGRAQKNRGAKGTAPTERGRVKGRPKEGTEHRPVHLQSETMEERGKTVRWTRQRAEYTGRGSAGRPGRRGKKEMRREEGQGILRNPWVGKDDTRTRRGRGVAARVKQNVGHPNSEGTMNWKGTHAG